MANNPIRRILVEGQVAFVTLTRGYTAVIDADNVKLIDTWNWTALIMRNTVYACRSYATSGGKQRKVLLHRAIMGEPAGLQVDHHDGDGLNNKRINLRVANNAQNSRNQRITSANTSGFNGVSWHRNSSQWQAYIKLDGKQYYLGLHATPEAAHTAYCQASPRLHADFGRTS